MFRRLTAHPAWPHLRGGLVAFHVAAITAGSLPVLIDERGLTPEAWQDPIAQREFAQWSETLTKLGLEVTPEEFGQGAWTAAAGLLRVQQTVKRPFLPYYEEFGTRQRWRMFPAALEEPNRLRIDIERDGEWRTVYRMGSASPGEGWLGRYFDRDRFRAALNLYAWNLYPESYDQFVAWLAAQAARDFPEGSRLRVGYEVVPVLTPAEAGAGRERTPLPWSEARQARVVALKPVGAAE